MGPSNFSEILIHFFFGIAFIIITPMLVIVVHCKLGRKTKRKCLTQILFEFENMNITQDATQLFREKYQLGKELDG
jgi:hypothetical protein